MMTPEYIQTLRRLMEFEASRTEPPAGFPALPDIPAGRRRGQSRFAKA